MPNRSVHYPAPDTATLRTLWRKYDDPEVRATILELVRLRDVARQTGDLCGIIEGAWKEVAHDKLIALAHLRALVTGERARSGILPHENENTKSP